MVFSRNAAGIVVVCWVPGWRRWTDGQGEYNSPQFKIRAVQLFNQMPHILVEGLDWNQEGDLAKPALVASVSHE